MGIKELLLGYVEQPSVEYRWSLFLSRRRRRRHRSLL